MAPAILGIAEGARIAPGAGHFLQGLRAVPCGGSTHRVFAVTRADRATQCVERLVADLQAVLGLVEEHLDRDFDQLAALVGRELAQGLFTRVRLELRLLVTFGLFMNPAVDAHFAQRLECAGRFIELAGDADGALNCGADGQGVQIHFVLSWWCPRTMKTRTALMSRPLREHFLAGLWCGNPTRDQLSDRASVRA